MWNNHALISRLITPRGGNIGGESVAREVSIGRDTIQIDEVKIQTSPLGNLRLIDVQAESSYDGTRFE